MSRPGRWRSRRRSSPALGAGRRAARPGVGAWTGRCGLSARTLTRLFVDETGQSYASWRTAARLHCAIYLLAEGLSVAAVARRVGYATSNAFITAFQRATAANPGTYFGSRRLAVPSILAHSHHP